MLHLVQLKNSTMRLFILSAFVALFYFNSFAADLLVPSQYPTIQTAIFAAASGDVIIVDNGTYYENINFYGKDVLLTSNFHTTGDPQDIKTTIIDGSQPADSDYASCVTFSTSETTASILKGFTITGGTGTKTYNAAEDLFFRTGGGILIDGASPTIVNNIITNNECTAEEGVFGAGGGGIRMGFGLPTIENNIIDGNTGGYAGGIMIAYCGGAVLKNNLIINNTATGSFNGGGGVYVDWESITLENNTIANNHSGDQGGGIISTGTSTIITNCIIYGNTAVNGSSQIMKRFGGNATITYTAIEGSWDGTGSEEGVISSDPAFENTDSFILTPTSPCVDTGNPDTTYNDVEDPASTGNALPPSKGTIRNDMGTYGGQGTALILSASDYLIEPEIINFNYANPYDNAGIYVSSKETVEVSIDQFSFDGKKLAKTQLAILNAGVTRIPVSISTTALVIFKTKTGVTKTIQLIKNNNN